MAAGASWLAACGPSEVPWSVVTLEVAAAPGAGQAHLAGGVDAPLLLSWQEPADDGGTALRLARFENSSWSDPLEVAAGSAWFVNWADFASVVPLRAGTVAQWLELKPDERYAYDIRYALARDGGSGWSEPRTLNADTAIAEHGFVSFFDLGEDIGAIWLDGRRVAALTIDELFELEEPVGMSLRYARIAANGAVLERGEIDELVCDCCQTDAVSSAAGPLIIYRDRTNDELRDIVVRRAVGPGGPGAGMPTRWSDPVVLGPDGWRIDGCPVNGPALATSGSHVAAAWFTAAEQRPRIRFARSRDGGASFEPAITVAAEGSLGQVDVVITADGTAWVSAWHRSAEGMELQVHRIRDGADSIESRVIATSASPLPSDVPQMAVADGQLVFAWSEIGNPGALFTATAPLW